MKTNTQNTKRYEVWIREDSDCEGCAGWRMNARFDSPGEAERERAWYELYGYRVDVRDTRAGRKTATAERKAA